jgi:hypothetical protein
MTFKKITCLPIVYLLLLGCVSTKSTLKNVDNSAPIPAITKENSFVLTAIATDSKYGFDKDYPINVFYRASIWDEVNQKRFLDALAGPNGEKIAYKRTGICCPFPSKNVNTGGGFLDTYEITYEGLKTPIILYINKYEKGILMAPVGFTVRKLE